jgi:hypothetical protein
MKITRLARFQNPANEYVLECSLPSLQGLVLGPLALGLHGAWAPALGFGILTVGTAGLLWIFLPFMITRLLRQHYMIAGWKELPADYYYLWGRPSFEEVPIKKRQTKAASPAVEKRLMRDRDNEPPSYQL